MNIYVNEILEHYKKWRAQFLDLPVVVLVLAQIKLILTGLSKSNESVQWKKIKEEGDLFSRRRALFVTTEAIGQISPDLVKKERRTLRENLGVLIKEGSSLHKVRALRAMRFIASEECLPYLEEGLRDKSSWVQANALHTLFRLNLRTQKARAVLLNFLFRSFWASVRLKTIINIMRNKSTPEHSIFKLKRGLISGLFKERGGKSLVLLPLVLWFLALLWRVLVFALVFGTAIIIASLGIYAGLGLTAIFGLIGFPIVVRFVNRPAWHGYQSPSYQQYKRKTIPPWLKLSLYILLDYIVVATVYFITPFPEKLWGIGTFLVLSALSIAGNKHNMTKTENIRGVNRGFLIFFCCFFLPLWKHMFFLFAAIGIIQVLWAFRKHLRGAVSGGGVSVMPKILKVVGSILLIPLGAPLVVLIIVIFLAVLFTIWPFILLSSQKWTIHSIRISILKSRLSYFEDFSDYFTYTVNVARTSHYPLWVRIRAILRLTEYPISDPGTISRLTDLAEEDLPAQLKDAVFQVIDAAEKRIQRGQVGGYNLERDVFSQKKVASKVSPGTILRPFLSVGLVLLIALCVVVAISWLNKMPVSNVIEISSFVQAILNIMLLGFLLLTMGTARMSRRWASILGLGMVFMQLTLPMQEQISANIISVNVLNLFFIDWGFFFPLLVPIWFFCLGGILGQTIYLLDCDYPMSKGPAIESPKTIIIMIVMAIFLSFFQSPVIQDFQENNKKSLAVFKLMQEGENRFQLQNIPNDGRMVRVALIKLESPDKFPSLIKTFPKLSTNKLTTGIFKSSKRIDIKQIYRQDLICKGEVWIINEGNHLKVWESLPNSNLKATVLGNDKIALHIANNYILDSPHRFLAIVYNLKRSKGVEKLANPTNLTKRYPKLSKKSHILVKTLSMLSREVWSPMLTAKD
jgi:hypothetical protein